MNEKIIINGYKCFGNETVIENPSLLNLIIGRNNSGKTTLTDIFEFLYSDDIREKSIDGVGFIFTLDEHTLKSLVHSAALFDTYKNTVAADKLPNPHILANEEIVVYVKKDDENKRLIPFEIEPLNKDIETEFDKIGQLDLESISNYFLGNIEKYFFHKISAERDIYEEEEEQHAHITVHGEGITKKVDELINVDGQNYNLIKTDLLNDLNKILKGENFYSEITTVKNRNGKKKSICLVEKGNRIRLNDMGSGVKTILFVLLVLLLGKKSASKSVFVFEELENNLHPEIQRRLFDYIYNYAIANNSYIFITSHSNVSINCFYGKNNASIYHVYKNLNQHSVVEKVDCDKTKRYILDDLGFKASDLFQTNGIIWVEGPSDRVYVKKWLEILYPDLKENVDFSFLYYGGKNLSHYKAGSSEENGLIDVLVTNRNAFIVMDHDEESANDELRSTKRRIIDEFQKNGMGFWVTAGREIENYLMAEDINQIYCGSSLNQVGDYERFSEYIKDKEPYFLNNKVSFARSLSFTEKSLNRLDLRERIEDLGNSILKWNRK